MKYLNLCWWGENGNWGDELNSILCSNISKQKINRISVNDEESTFRYYCIGSILQTPKSSNFDVWGTGFISHNSKINFKPNKVHSVRGPLTRELLLRQDIDCPSIYGDPALLYPLFYKPLEVKKKYRYGLIPHYLDFNNDWIKKFENNKDVKIINIRVNSINSFIDEISECEMILSSSLHGIIAGDSYGIPSYWMELSKNVQGNGFKFKDYFSSVGRPIEEPIRPNYSDWIKTFSDRYYKYKIDINLDLLYNACPFKKD